MDLLLDTCALLWLADRQSPRETTKDAWSNVLASDGNVLLSPMSAWEVSMLQAKTRLSISQDISLWFEEIMSVYDIDWVELSPSTLIAANDLPGLEHRDPVDRILIATARRLSLQIVTADREILNYGARGFVDVLEW